MFTVALLAQKGGVGKTTLALTLAVQAEQAGFTSGVIDADPQATASGWFLSRQQNTKRNTPTVASVDSPESLREAFAAAGEENIAWLFIDTPPGVSEIPATAAAVADLVLMPCAPSMFNMDAAASTVKLARHAQKPAFFLINKGRSKGINDECAVALTSGYGLPAVHTHISHRLPISDAERTGTTLLELATRNSSVDKGKREFRALWSWLIKQKLKTDESSKTFAVRKQA